MPSLQLNCQSQLIAPYVAEGHDLPGRRPFPHLRTERVLCDQYPMPFATSQLREEVTVLSTPFKVVDINVGVNLL